MTGEEAIKKLKEQQNEFNEHWIDYAGINEAYNMAIKALEQQTCEDCISRKIDEFEIKGKTAEIWIIKGKLQIRYLGVIHNIPLSLITPLYCEDCISREKALNVVHKYFEHYLQLNDDICLDGLRSLPSVTPKEKTRWIPVSERLPEEFESVLVCYESQGGMAQAVSERFGTHTGYRWSALAGIEPIAWMPLPKPYKPQESEDKE